MESQWMDAEDTRRFEMGLPVKTYSPGPGVVFEGSSYPYPRAGTTGGGTWTDTRKGGIRERRERSRTAVIKLLSQLDRTGRLIAPTFSREVAFEANNGIQGTVRPTLRYSKLDDSPEAVADRIAWATAHRYLSEYHDKYSETAKMSATARAEAAAMTSSSTPHADLASPQPMQQQRPSTAAPLRTSRPPSAAALRASRPSSARAADSREDLVEAAFPKDWNSLNSKDLARTKPSEQLGQHVVPGSQNAKLVGGRFRLVPGSVEGEAQWTDYYGPVGGGAETHTYYGRKYNQKTGRPTVVPNYY